MDSNLQFEPKTEGQEEWLSAMKKVEEATKGLDESLDDIANFEFPEK